MEVVRAATTRLRAQLPLQLVWTELGRRGAGELKRAQQSLLATSPSAPMEATLLLDVLLYTLGHLEVQLLPSPTYEAAEEACKALGTGTPPPHLIQQILATLPEPQLEALKDLFRLLHSLTRGDAGEATVLAQLVSPNIGRPAGAARLSLRHKEGLAAIERFVRHCIELSDVIFLKLDLSAPPRGTHEAGGIATSPQPPTPLFFSPRTGSPMAPGPATPGHAHQRELVVIGTLLRATVMDMMTPGRQEPLSPMDTDAPSQMDEEDAADAAAADAGRPEPPVALGSPLGGDGSISSVSSPMRGDRKGAPGASPKSFGPFGSRRVAGAAERRRMVQACRVLRSQISKFEERFAEVHGHPPKGTERLGLGTTYAQYRSWKKYIREDAAQHIQRCFRRYCRRKENARERGAGTMEGELNGASGMAWSGEGAGARRILSSSTTGNANSRPGEQEDLGKGDDEDAVEKLLRQKRLVKQQLKRFDQEFYASHGRLPKKSEKEPIRRTYEIYNGIKKELEKYHTSSDEAMDLEGEDAPPPGQAASGLVEVAARPRPVAVETDPAATVLFEGRMQPLIELRKERKILHRVLRQFEEEFKSRSGRDVSCAEDIAPVAAEYARYKEIKRALGSTS